MYLILIIILLAVSCGPPPLPPVGGITPGPSGGDATLANQTIIINAISALGGTSIGQMTDASHTGATDNTTTVMGYTKQLVTDERAGFTAGAKDSTVAKVADTGTVATAAHTGAVDAITTIVGYIKQLVTDEIAGFTAGAKTAELISGAAVDFGSTAKTSLQTAAQAAITASSLATSAGQTTIINDLAVPTANASTNTNERDVIGNKTDTAVTTVGTTASNAAMIKGILADQGKQLTMVTFYSDPVLGLTLPASAGTLAIGTVAVAGLPAGVTVVHAKCFLVSRIIENLDTAATNYIDGATVANTSQVIQVKKGAGAYADCITFLAGQASMYASGREGGPVFVCANDMASTITGNDTYTFQWLLAKAHSASLYLQGVHCIIQLWYSVP